jgi:hypothetical protein
MLLVALFELLLVKSSVSTFHLVGILEAACLLVLAGTNTSNGS